jgi:type VI secretion system secreted protein VgrG
MASQLSQDDRIAALKTPLGENVLVVTRFDAGEGLSELFEYRIEALSDRPDIDFDSLIGQHCTLKFRTRGRDERIFDGVLAEGQRLGEKDELYTYRLTLKPWFWLLSRTTDCEIFPNMTAPDIIKKIFSDGGYSDYRPSLTESYPEIEYCVQYRESDFTFVSRLMEQWGIYYFFEHEDSKHTMVLADSKSSHQPIPSHATMTYVPLVEHDRLTDDHLYRLTGGRRLRTGRVALNDYDPMQPNANLLTDSSGREKYTHSDKEHYDYPGNYTDTEVGERFAKVRLQAEQAVDRRRSASGDAASLFPGGLFTLQEHPAEVENQEYLVVRCTHAFVSQSYRSSSDVAYEDGGGQSYFGSYELLPSRRPFRAPLLTDRPIVHGAQTAKVVGKAGEEIDVDEHGRITVQFYWDRNKTPSCRVRIAQVWSGKAWGGIFIPRIDQEVVVVFLEGDPDRPLVVGTVYNADNTVPYDLPSEKTKGGIKSDSTKGHGGYNEWVFDDKKGSELITGHAQKDLEFTVLNNEKWDIKVDSDTTVGQNITVDAGQKITVTAGVQIELKVGQNKVVIDQTGVTIKGVVKVDIGAPMTKVEGSAILTVKGGMVLIN